MHYEDQNQIRKVRLKYAVFWQKFFAFLVDSFILAASIVLIASHFDIDPNEKNVFVIYILLSSFYFTCFLSLLQKSPGGMAIGIKVCNEVGGKIRFDQACIRSIISILSLSMVGFGYLMAAFNDESQTLHDKIARTYVTTEIDGSNFKGFLSSVFFVVSVIIFYNSLEVAGTLVGTVGLIDNSGGGTQALTKGQITNPKWITSGKKIKKKSLSKRKVYKSLKIKTYNRMADKLKKMQKISRDDDFKKLIFEKIIPLKLRGVFINLISEKLLQVGTLNNLFYQVIDFDVLDSQGKKLKRFAHKFYNETIIRSYVLSKASEHKTYKLRIYFPRKYMIVYFSKNDLVNAAYKLTKGSVVQLKKKSDKNFTFAVKGSQSDLEKLNFVAFNYASKVMGLNPKIINSKNIHTLSLSSKRESIAFVAFMYFKKKEHFEESFEIESSSGSTSQALK